MRGRIEKGAACLCLPLICLTFVALALVGVAAAATLHEFNPKLSLTGSCKVFPDDLVPDPSCPYPEPPSPLTPTPFSSPTSIVTDSYGNIYVDSFGTGEPGGAKGRIDVFTSKGFYIEGSEIAASHGPSNLMVDSKGNLYVFEAVASKLMRYEPTLYNPAAGEIAYGKAPVFVANMLGSTFVGLGINAEDDHLFAHIGRRIVEYKSAEESNEVVNGKIGEDVLTEGSQGIGLAVDTAHKRIYASDTEKVRVFELEEPHNLLATIESLEPCSEEELTNFLSIAVDEGTGHFFVFNGNHGNNDKVYEFDEEGKCLEVIKHSFQDTFGNEITVDNGKNSPNGKENPFGRFLYVPSHPTGTGHSFAFGPPEPKEPAIEATSVSGGTETEAKLEATIKPEFLETTYTLKYTTLEAFEAEAEKFESATLAASGTIAAGGSPFKASASLSGLAPGTAYIFQVVAENEKGKAEARREFATFPATQAPPACENDAFRIGPSELLPDCRAYELVTPPDTNARAPLGVGYLGSAYFATLGASPDGNAATFEIEGGTIPGFEGTGSYAGDPYVVHRTASGWQTEYAGPTPAEASALLPGSNSPDQGYSFWTVNGEGSAAIEEKATAYIRYPDGHFALVGRGTLANDPRAQGNLIAENGSHIIFTSGTIAGPAIQLEEDAPPSGTKAIYDRTADEVTHVVSLLPEDETPATGQNAFYKGASLDGKAVAFRFGGAIPTSPLYFRHNNEETYEIAPVSATFAGFAREDKRAFYVEGGNLFAFDIELDEAGEGPVQFSSSGNVTPVNVAPNGSVAYFLSPSVLVSEPNPSGDLPVGGGQNLYRSEEGILSFVGTVTKEDVEGVETGIGLGKWTDVIGEGRAAGDPSRITPDGQVLLFESEAALTAYDPEGNSEVYRYDVSANELSCLSCSPTLAPARGDATLQTVSLEQGAAPPLGPFAQVDNLRSDGQRAFFQSPDALAIDDTDGLQDVYEWEAAGVGSCEEAGGCVYLISSGHSKSGGVDYLWAVSDSGDNVFFRSNDLLTGSDKDETPSIYDARVGGGFAEAVKKEPCQGEGCHPDLTGSPQLPTPGMLPDTESGNPPVACPKGKRKVKRNGKTVCVKKKKHHKKHHRKAGAKRKGASK